MGATGVSRSETAIATPSAALARTSERNKEHCNSAHQNQFRTHDNPVSGLPLVFQLSIHRYIAPRYIALIPTALCGACANQSLSFLCNYCLVVIARGSHPFPYRTRKLSPSAPMVLRFEAVGE
jgi:hypothetical protein